MCPIIGDVRIGIIRKVTVQCIYSNAFHMQATEPGQINITKTKLNANVKQRLNEIEMLFRLKIFE